MATILLFVLLIFSLWAIEWYFKKVMKKQDEQIRLLQELNEKLKDRNID